MTELLDLLSMTPVPKPSRSRGGSRRSGASGARSSAGRESEPLGPAARRALAAACEAATLSDAGAPELWRELLTAICEQVRAAPEGRRRNALNDMTFFVGGLVGAGFVPRADAERELIAAGMATGLESDEASDTTTAALDEGSAQPFVPEPRDHQDGCVAVEEDDDHDGAPLVSIDEAAPGAVAEALAAVRPETLVLVALRVGLGKTTAALLAIGKMVAEGKVAVIAAPDHALARQLFDDFAQLHPDLRHRAFHARGMRPHCDANGVLEHTAPWLHLGRWNVCTGCQFRVHCGGSKEPAEAWRQHQVNLANAAHDRGDDAPQGAVLFTAHRAIIGEGAPLLEEANAADLVVVDEEPAAVELAEIPLALLRPLVGGPTIQLRDWAAWEASSRGRASIAWTRALLEAISKLAEAVGYREPIELQAVAELLSERGLLDDLEAKIDDLLVGEGDLPKPGSGHLFAGRVKPETFPSAEVLRHVTRFAVALLEVAGRPVGGERPLRDCELSIEQRPGSALLRRRQQWALPAAPTIVLDGTASWREATYRAIAGSRELVIVKRRVELPAPVAAWRTGSHGMARSRLAEVGDPVPHAFGYIRHAVELACDAWERPPQRVGLISHKPVIELLSDDLEGLADVTGCEPVLAWHGALRGLNAMARCELLIVLGDAVANLTQTNARARFLGLDGDDLEHEVTRTTTAAMVQAVGRLRALRPGARERLGVYVCGRARVPGFEWQTVARLGAAAPSAERLAVERLLLASWRRTGVTGPFLRPLLRRRAKWGTPLLSTYVGACPTYAATASRDVWRRAVDAVFLGAVGTAEVRLAGQPGSPPLAYFRSRVELDALLEAAGATLVRILGAAPADGGPSR